MRTNGVINTFFNTSTIDTATVSKYNREIKNAIANNATFSEKQQIMQSAMNGTNKATARLIASTKGAAVSTEALTAAQEESTVASKAATIGMKAFAMAGNMAAMWAITKGIELATKGIEYLTTASERAIEKTREVQQEISQISSDYQSERQTLEGLREEYDTLTSKIGKNGAKASLSADEYERYRDITSEILGITPKLITGWNEEGEAISNKNNLIQASIDLLDEEYEKALRNNTTKSKNEDIASGVIAELDEFNNSVDTTTMSGTMWNMREKFLQELEKLETELGMTEYEIVKKMWDYLDPDKEFYEGSMKLRYVDLRTLIEKDYDKLANSFTDENNPIYELFSDEVIDDMIRNADEYFAEGQRILEEREILYQGFKDQLSWNAQATQDKNGNNAYQQLSENGKAFINEYIEELDYASVKTEEDFVEMASSFIRTQ